MKDGVVYSTVGWKKYLDFRNNPNSNYINKHGYVLFSRVSQLVYNAWKNKLENTPILKFKNSKILAVVSDTEYYDVLESARLWFESEEYYEKCAWIRDIQMEMK